jgi:serine/threonine protein kinase
MPYTTEPDWWSLGVTVFVLFSDKMPFSGKTEEEKNEATVKGEIEYKHGESDELQKFVSALCTVDQKARLGCTDGLQEVMVHPYFNGFNW